MHIVSDVTMWLFYGDFIFVTELTILYTIKIVASFYKVQCEHIKRGVMGCAHCVCFKFPSICFYQELSKFDDIWPSYHKYKKGETQCSNITGENFMCIFTIKYKQIIQWMTAMRWLQLHSHADGITTPESTIVGKLSYLPITLLTYRKKLFVLLIVH